MALQEQGTAAQGCGQQLRGYAEVSPHRLRTDSAQQQLGGFMHVPAGFNHA